MRQVAILWICAVAVMLCVVPAKADFTPTHPFVYMDQGDIDVMRDNVLNKKYPWVVNLYNKAKLSRRSGSWETLPRTYTIGKDMLGCALVYLIDGNTSYADGAIHWLNLYKTRYDPDDQSSYGTVTLGKKYHFEPTQVLVPIVYDLMYNYMKANRPADLAALTTYIGWFADNCRGSFDHNENAQEHYAEGICGLVLGDTSHITEIENAFKAWYVGGINSETSGGYYYEPGSQAVKHLGFVFESHVHYVLAAHNAAAKGYTSWDPVTWKNSRGNNVIRDLWRMLAKKSTPKFQVPFESMWKANLYYPPKTTGFYNAAYVMTGNPEWQAIAAENPGREIHHHRSTNTYWMGLSHGREITGTPRFKNDSVKNKEIGFNVVLSGDPAGTTDKNSCLHAYMMTGNYGETRCMTLKYYGKGKKLTASLLAAPRDSWGLRMVGGNAVVVYDNAEHTEIATEHAWDVSDPVIKVMAYENIGQHRAVATTDDYFVDVYDVNLSGTVTYDYNGIGPSNTALSKSGTVTGDFSCTYPGYQKIHFINDVSSSVSLSSDDRLPWQETGVENRLVNPIYTTEDVRKLRVRRSSTGSTRFISVIEPLGQGTVLTSVSRFNTANTAQVTGLKIAAAGYTDYYFYNDGTGTHTLTNGGETVTLNGRWGFIRKNSNGSLLVKGSISSHNIDGTPVPTYTLTVQNGNGGGSYPAGTSVAISAASGPAGQVFDKWTGSSAIADVNSAATTISMPAANTTVTATYRTAVTYALTVNSGTGDGNYEAGAKVTVQADAPATGKMFDRWTGSTTGLSSVTTSTATFTMPAAAASITAAYKDAPVSGQTPYGGSAHAVPGRIEAEHYDEGGQGVAYSDRTTGNQGGEVRTDDVDIYSTTDGGTQYKLGYNAGDEWVEYTVNAQAGTYTIRFRTATTKTDGTVRVSINGSVAGTVDIPNTGGWDNFTDVEMKGVAVGDGEQVIRLDILGSGWDLNWFEFEAEQLTILQDRVVPGIRQVRSSRAIGLNGRAVGGPTTGIYFLMEETPEGMVIRKQLRIR